MSLANKAKEWFRKNYEMMILLATLIALLGSAAFLFIRADAENRKLTDIRDVLGNVGHEAEPIDIGALGDAFTEIKQTLPLREFETRMFVSEQRVACIFCEKPIPYYADECPYCGTEQPPMDRQVDLSLDSSGDRIPDWWKEKHGFDVHDPRDAQQDADGDGFTNLEEYLAGTDPRDPESHPPYVERLRLLRVERGEFQLRFNSVQEMPGGVLRFQLNLRTLERTYFPQLGDVINDEDNEVVNVKIAEYIPDADEGPTLIVERDADRISLVRGELHVQDDLTAVMAFLVDRQPIRVGLGEIISLRDEEYKVVDLRRNSVIVESLETGERVNVPRLSADERRELRGEPESDIPEAPSGLFERFGERGDQLERPQRPMRR